MRYRRYWYDVVNRLLGPPLEKRSSVSVGVSVCVCVSVRKHIRNHTFNGSNSTKCSLHVACGRGSVLSRWHCDMLHSSGFADDVMAQTKQVWCKLRVTQQGTARDQGGAECGVYDCLVGADERVAWRDCRDGCRQWDELWRHFISPSPASYIAHCSRSTYTSKHHYPRQLWRGTAFTAVCLSVCEWDNSKSYGWIFVSLENRWTVNQRSHLTPNFGRLGVRES